MDPHARLMAQRFAEQARRELEVARALLSLRTYYVCAYQAHQAAEKMLKALLWHATGQEPPWIHGLVKLTDRISTNLGTVPAEVRMAV